jgi:hypothetical protein
MSEGKLKDENKKYLHFSLDIDEDKKEIHVSMFGAKDISFVNLFEDKIEIAIEKPNQFVPYTMIDYNIKTFYFKDLLKGIINDSN